MAGFGGARITQRVVGDPNSDGVDAAEREVALARDVQRLSEMTHRYQHQLARSDYPSLRMAGLAAASRTALRHCHASGPPVARSYGYDHLRSRGREPCSPPQPVRS
jgi:hypothetical protein